MQYPVSTIAEAYIACNPDEALEKMNDTRYVDLSEVRGNNFVRIIARQIERTSPAFFHQQLVTGHRGCGKSTELYRLTAQLTKDKFFTIYFDVEKMLDLGEVNYLDILVAIACATEQQVREHDFVINSQLLEEIYHWFADKVLTQERKHELELTVKGEAEVGSKIPFLGKLLAAFTSEIHSGSSRREEIRIVLEKELSVFIKRLNQLIEAARQQVQQGGYKDLVIIVDGLEKMHYRELADGQSTHAALFVHHAEQLKAPACSVIYTLPISLRSNANLMDAFPAPPFIFPMVNYTTEQGRAKLIEVIAKRVNIDKVFCSPDLVGQLVEISGGVMRDLMHVVRMACDGEDDCITTADIDDAIATLVRELDRKIREDEVNLLRQVREKQHVPADEKYARLLHLRLILEYQNHHRWADLHPAIQELISKR